MPLSALLINDRQRDYTQSMPLTEAHVVPLLVALAVIAIVLGIAAHLLAVRLLLDCGKAANDPAWRRERISHRARRPAARAALRLVRRGGTPRKPALTPGYFPESAYRLTHKPLLRRVS